jgi:hypothetical protein
MKPSMIFFLQVCGLLMVSLRLGLDKKKMEFLGNQSLRAESFLREFLRVGKHLGTSWIARNHWVKDQNYV